MYNLKKEQLDKKHKNNSLLSSCYGNWISTSTANFSQKEHVSGAERERASGKSGERERSGERVSQK